MGRTLRVCTWTMTLILGATLSTALLAKAQNVSADSTGRRVLSKAVPTYPEIARTAHITGKVRIEVTVAPDGHVLNTRVVGGSPVLINAAVDALEKWRFEAAQTQTTEIIQFQFDGDN